MYIKTRFGEFEWDEAKAAYNWHKHQVRFVDAIEIFSGKTEDYIDERFDYGETRKISIGLMAGQLLVATVTHTGRGQITRIISARPASRKERARFAAAQQGNDSPL